MSCNHLVLLRLNNSISTSCPSFNLIRNQIWTRIALGRAFRAYKMHFDHMFAWERFTNNDFRVRMCVCVYVCVQTDKFIVSLSCQSDDWTAVPGRSGSVYRLSLRFERCSCAERGPFISRRLCCSLKWPQGVGKQIPKRVDYRSLRHAK